MNRKNGPKQLAIFRREFERLVKRWGCEDWRYYFDLATLAESKAQVSRNLTGRACTVTLGVDWPCDNSPDELRKTARHEAAHMVTAELSCLAGARWVTKDEVDNADELTVRRLERILR